MEMAGALAGVRILDLTAVVSGPLATMMLADQGADVVKIEPPQIGDITRPMGVQRGGISAIFASLNRNKRSVALDLAKPEGRDLFLELCREADVVVQNYRPGAVDRIGVGYDAVSAVNPDIVYVSINGFGSSGPYSQRGVYDPLIQAASGMAMAQGCEGGVQGEPKLVRTIFCDKVTALTAAQAITAALFARERGAGGQHVQLAMLDAALAFHWSDLMWSHTFQGDEGVVQTPELADMFRVSKSRDGWVVVVAGTDAHFRSLCEAFDRPEMADDPRYLTLLDRMQNMESLLAWMESELAKRGVDELCAVLDEHGVPCARVNALEDLADDPQVSHNGLLYEEANPLGGPMRFAGPPSTFAATPCRVDRPAPALGEHTREVLLEAGLGSDAVADLIRRQILA